MNNTKISIIFYSATGVNYQMASWAAQAAEAAGAEVRLRRVHELAPDKAIDSNPAWRATADAIKSIPEASADDLDWADAILFSVPTRFGNMAAQMKQFIDLQGPLWAQGKLVNKAVSGMTSAQNPHGGQEMTLQSLYTPMMHWGAVIVPPGYTDDSLYPAGGNPYGTSATQQDDGGVLPEVRPAVEHQTRRLLEIAGWLKSGRQNA